MNSYFGYTRVSTARQGEHGSSLQEQKSAIEAYAARSGLHIAAWFEERETAAKHGRRIFNQMLGELTKGRAAGVVIHKIDRSARNLGDWAHLGELIDRGVEVHFAHESVDLQSRGGRLSADIQAVVAADYIRNLRQEVKKGFYGRLKQGLYPMGAPTGYRNEGGGKAKSVDPVKGPLILSLFEQYASGRYTMDALRHEMHRQGLSGAGGAALSLNAIAIILRNPFYIGLMRLRRTGETYQGVHTPIVSKRLFEAVQRRLDGRAYPHVVKHGFLLRWLITCAACTRSLTGELQKGRVYYRCHSASCPGASIREDAAIAALQGVMALLVLTDAELQDLRDFGDEIADLEVQQAKSAQLQTSRAVGLCESRLARLTDAFLDGNVDKETYEERKAALLQERTGLRELLSDPSAPSPSATLMEKFELGRMAQLSLENGSERERREIMEMVISNFSIQGKNVTITPRFPFSEVIKASSVPSGGPDWDRLRTPRSACLRRLMTKSVDETLDTSADQKL